MLISDNDGDVHQRVHHQGGGALEAYLGPHEQLIRCLGLAGDVLQLVGHQDGGAHGAPLSGNKVVISFKDLLWGFQKIFSGRCLRMVGF